MKKRALAFLLVLLLLITAVTPAMAADTANVQDKLDIGVINFTPVWSDKDANVAQMKDYINQAHKEGVNMLLFPELCVTGYASSDTLDSDVSRTLVSLAETKSGPTATEISALAQEYNMWVVYGATESIQGDTQHAYDSMFACSPDGKVTTYQKIQPEEGAWCTPGKTPTMLDTQWGKIGLSIGDDTFEYPELERIYAGYGCRLLLSSNALSRNYDWKNNNSAGWKWYYNNRLQTISSREGVFIASANLTGEDGPSSNGVSDYHFPGGSVVIGPAGWSNPTYRIGSTDNKTAGLYHTDIDLSDATVSTTQLEAIFNPALYSKLYQELADKQAQGETLQYTPTTTDGPVAAVAKCTAKWGDKQANIDMMIDYIKQAAEQKVEILVFPETILCGYKYVEPKNGEPCMQHQLAESVPGPTSEIISKYAKEYGMYIVYGMCEQKDGQYYNSAAVCTPDGDQRSYQKITPCGDELYWAVPGTTPLILDSKWGKMGVNICMDGHYEPEVGRYYAASGCTILLHPTATSGDYTYRVSRMGSYTDRDNMAVISCNTTGMDGPNAEDPFWSTSIIITKYLDSSGKPSYDPETGYAISLNGTATDGVGSNGLPVDKQGLSVAKMNLTGLGFNQPNINAQLYADEYKKLADYAASSETNFFDIAYNEDMDSIRSAYHAGIINGTTPTTFSPNRSMTRAEFAAILVRQRGLTGTYANAFTDVSSDAWYADYVAAVTEAGIMQGTGDNTFDPMEPITRQEAMTVLARANQGEAEDLDVLNAYTDTSTLASWARDGAAYCVEAGLILGDDGKLNPLSSITRAQATVILLRSVD